MHAAWLDWIIKTILLLISWGIIYKHNTILQIIAHVQYWTVVYWTFIKFEGGKFNTLLLNIVVFDTYSFNLLLLLLFV